MRSSVGAFILYGIIVLSIILLALPAKTLGAPIDNIKLFTEVSPPYAMKENNEAKGISVDILDAILIKIGSNQRKKNVIFVPWARGYNIVQKENNTLLFTMVRTEKRENLFKWAGPIMTLKVSVISLKSKGIKINSKSDLSRFQVGVIRDDIGEQLATEAGIPESNLQKTAANISNIKKLLNGRIDLWVYVEGSALWQIKKAGYNVDEFETVYTLMAADMYFAFNKGVLDSEVAAFQNALDEVKNTGQYQKILDKYLK